jgi:tRNA U34 5-methylaminomethyl-2-thiouridine-forming methyltransferase MnmC
MSSRHQRPRVAIGHGIEIVRTDDGSHTLFDTALGESFHSESGAVAEASHVFLQTSGVTERLRRREPTRILEIGFGTGLNFLMTATLAIENPSRLQFVSIDTRWYGECLSQLNFEQVGVNAALLAGYSRWALAIEPSTSALSWRAPAELGSITLQVVLGRAEEQVPAFPDAASFDAVYLDAFSPESCPVLWEAAFLQSLNRQLKPGGILATYCVKSEVQRRLKTAGFMVQKHPGPLNGKREVLAAVKTG